MSLISKESGILTFGIYKELFPLVIEAYNFLYKQKNNLENHNLIYQNTIENLINILSFLSKGYNKFYSKDKYLYYSQSRDCVSQTQSNLLIISEFLDSNLDKEKILNIYNNFEEKIKYFNGLIKKMEEKQNNSK